MNEYNVKRLALVLALQAEIEGMKAKNTARERQNYAAAYDENSFLEMAENLRKLADTPDEQL